MTNPVIDQIRAQLLVQGIESEAITAVLNDVEWKFEQKPELQNASTCLDPDLCGEENPYNWHDACNKPPDHDGLHAHMYGETGMVAW